MKIAVLSDIHANRQALEAVLSDCEAERVDAFWLLGDYVDYGADNISVLRMLQSLDLEHALAGNHDACLFLPDVNPSQTPNGQASYLQVIQCMAREPDAFEWLKALSPAKAVMEDTVLLVHGTPADPYWGKFLPEDENALQEIISFMRERGYKYLFMGHSHVSFIITRDGCNIVNPGSVGQPRNGIPLAQYAIFENGNIIFKKIEYDIDAAASEIKKAGLPEYLWSRLYEGK